MLKRCVAVFVFLLLAVPAFAYDRVDGWCEDGNYTVSVPGGAAPSANKYQRSFPSCTVTVYNAGTLTLATIFADNSGTAKANPFMAATAGRWFFYANNGRFDVKLSGGGIASPFTLGDNITFDEKMTIGYNVRIYGATGDGTTVDDTAFTNAIAAARTSGARKIYIPQGTYRLTTQVLSFLNDGMTNDSGFTIECETPNERWRSQFYPVRIDYRGTGAAVKLSASANNSLTSFTIHGCQFDGRNITPGTAVNGLTATATAGSSIDGLRVSNSGFTNFPQYQIYYSGTVFDTYFDNFTAHNANQSSMSGNLFQVEATNAGQISFNNPWLAQYTTGKWNFFAGRTAGLPTNAVSDVRFIGGSVIANDAVNNVANGANGIWVYGGLQVIGTHLEDACECNHPRSIGIRYTGANAATLLPSTNSFWGTGVELGNSGNEVGGSALTSTEAVGAFIGGANGFNNNCVAPITCSDVRVVGGSGNRSGTNIQITGIYSVAGNFGTTTGEPYVYIDLTANATNANNVFQLTRTFPSGGYPSLNGSLFFDNTNSRVAVGTGAYAPALKFNVAAGAGDGIRLLNTANAGAVTAQILNDGSSAAGNLLLYTSGVVNNFYAAGDGQLGVGTAGAPGTKVEFRTVKNNGVRLSDSDNSNRVTAQILTTAGDQGQLLLYDSAQTVRVTEDANANGGLITLSPYVFANLPASANGTFLMCTDCTRGSDPCSGTGTGTMALRIGGAWVCKFVP